jgi:hypothetical protein
VDERIFILMLILRRKKMENNTKNPLENPSHVHIVPAQENFPAQELVANPVYFQIERSMTEILSERKADAISTKIVAVFVP